MPSWGPKNNHIYGLLCLLGRLRGILQKLSKKTNEKFLYSKYLTTFLPVVFKDGRLEIGSIFNKNFFGYLRNYLGYCSAKIKNLGDYYRPSLIYYLLVFFLFIGDLMLGSIKKLLRKKNV
jgi:hypothetical protein